MKIWTHSFSTRIDGTGVLVEKANDYFEILEVQGFSYRTIATYAFVLIPFFRWISKDFDKFQQFTQKDLQDWMIFLKNEKLKPTSINQRLCCVRAFYRFCFGKELPHAPGVLYQRASLFNKHRSHIGLNRTHRKTHLELRVKVPSRIIDPLTAKEVDKFLDQIDRYRDLAIVLTMLLCGLRTLEVILLKLQDVDFHQSSLRVHGKGNKERLLPLPFRLMQVYEKYLEYERPTNSTENFFVILQGNRTGEALTRSGLRSYFRKRRVKLDLPKAKPHQFRHVFASDMARAGVPITTIRELLGHADLKTCLIYIDLFLDDIKADYDKAMKVIEERYAALSK